MATTAALVVALLGLLAFPAAASEPPGWVDQPLSGTWVGFSISSTSPAVDRLTGIRASVTLTRETNAADVVATFDNWEYGPPGAVTPEPGWPDEWSAGGVRLRRVDDWCPAAAASCQYTFESGDGERFDFSAASTEADGSGNREDLSRFNRGPISLALPAEISIDFSWDPVANRTPASGATPGRLTLSARATDGYSPNLRYDWRVTPQGGAPISKAGQLVEFDLGADGEYCVGLTVTNTDDGYSKNYYGVGPDDCRQIDQLTPPGNTPGSGNGGGAGNGAGSGAGGINVVFAPPRRASSALTGNGGGDNVVWLWRPEFFQPGAEGTQALPRTGGRTPLEGRADIVVAPDATPDSNATPMLAGLGIFGVVGVGWLFSRRRRIRADP